MRLAGNSEIYPSRRSNALRCSERNEDCKLIELWRNSFYMSAEGESAAVARISQAKGQR